MPIWEMIAANPEQGAKALLAAYKERLHAFAYRLCGSGSFAEDLTMRTMERAVRANGRFASEQAYFTFLCTILVNLYRDDMRLKAANALDFMEETPEMEDSRPTPADALAAKSDAEAVKYAISRLSPILRESLVMRYYGGLSIEEIAKALSAPEGTIKFRLSEARRKIQEFLTQRGGAFAR